jgi:hypothetical protein
MVLTCCILNGRREEKKMDILRRKERKRSKLERKDKRKHDHCKQVTT